MGRLLFFILMVISTDMALGQNLVQNPSLENYDDTIDGWKIVAGTPDIASRENKIKAKAPFFNPFSVVVTHPQRLGSIAFGDVCLCQGFNSQWSEVSQVELLQPLKRKQRYVVSLYVIKSSSVDGAISEVSVAFTRRELKPSYTPFAYQIPFVSLKSAARPLLSSRGEWVKVEAIFTAIGGEKFLAIGNLVGANKAGLAKLSGPYQSNYYCYDNVRVTLLDSTGSEAEPAVVSLASVDVKADTPDTPHKAFTLEDASFAFNSYELQAVALAVLDSLLGFLRKHPATTVHITGYTDDVGNHNDNLDLSKSRANAVKEYLVLRGITAQRIAADGMGELKPKAGNQTEEGKAMNRRVEIKLIAKQGDQGSR